MSRADDTLSDAYVAGLFDGEGCVKLCPYKTKAGIRYQIAVTVSNTEMSLLEPLREVYGGCVRSSGKQISPTHRKALAWEARSRVAAAFLARALPHMRSPMKIHRAKVALAVHAARGQTSDTMLDDFYRYGDCRRRV
jgi:hypothetical protein